MTAVGPESTPAETQDTDATNDDDVSAERDDAGETSSGAEGPLAALETPPPAPVTGIIRGLAAAIAAKSSLLLAITKLEDDSLLVTIQPTRQPDEPGAAALPLQVTGSAEEIDQSLVEELAHYVPARQLAIQSAAEVANATTRASQAARDAAAKRAEAAKPKPRTGYLTLKTAPKDATISVTDAAGKAHEVTQGKRTSLPVGRYTVVVSKEGHQAETRTVTVGQTAVDLTVELNLANLTLAFEGVSV